MSSEHAIRSVQMGLDMIDILGELAQDNIGVDLNMRVGIHSGRALCGVLGKKKWQFDVHSNDVELANHMEQASVPGRVHITEDTLRALDGRFQVEPANGHLRDTCIAQRNIATYFVMAPMRNQPSDLMNAVNGLSNVGTDSTIRTQPAVTTNSQAPTIGQQQAKLRFKLATQRIINALHFIRTIDAPFSNLQDTAADEATAGYALTGENIDRMLNETISTLRQEQNHQIGRLTLKFKDSNLRKLFAKRPVRIRVTIIRFLLLAFSLLCLMFLAHQSSLVNSNSKQDFGFIKSPYIWILAIAILSFIMIILVYMHQSEFNARRDFLWRQAAIQDKHRVALIRDCNKFILFNLLPPHVASYFLQDRQAKQQQRHRGDLYYKSYERIGVVFASVSNFSEFYSEVQGNNHGLGCLLLLNEIICDFDTILDDEKFKSVDKIKTIGSTYMAAIGLFPQYQLPSGSIECSQVEKEGGGGDTISEHNSLCSNTSQEIKSETNTPKSDGGLESNHEIYENRQLVAKYLQTLVNFVMEMRSRLRYINEHSYNNFKLRVGINFGPVTAGVIGASKPQYDIWGNTVNVASRMESTCEIGRIQITEEVYEILKDFNHEQNFQFTSRGSINVKGKGMMTTYYLDGPIK